MTGEDMRRVLEMKRAEIDVAITELDHVLSVLTGHANVSSARASAEVPDPIVALSPKPRRVLLFDRKAILSSILTYVAAHPGSKGKDIRRSVPGSAMNHIHTLRRQGHLRIEDHTTAARYYVHVLQEETGT